MKNEKKNSSLDTSSHAPSITVTAASIDVRNVQDEEEEYDDFEGSFEDDHSLNERSDNIGSGVVAVVNNDELSFDNEDFEDFDDSSGSPTHHRYDDDERI